MVKRIMHLSDLHFGKSNTPTLESIRKFVELEKPNLVIVSGDLTQRSRKIQFQEAKSFLDSLSSQKFLIPGNHDIPLYMIWRRFLNPFANFKSIISNELEPSYVDHEVSVMGANTVSRWSSEAWLLPRYLRRIQERLDKNPENTINLLVSHHPLSTRRLKKYPLKAHILLSGHTHYPRCFIETSDDTRNYLRIEAGTTTSSRLRTFMQNSFNYLYIEKPFLTVHRYDWDMGTRNFQVMDRKKFSIQNNFWTEIKI